jgi:hypothetical protein
MKGRGGFMIRMRTAVAVAFAVGALLPEPRTAAQGPGPGGPGGGRGFGPMGGPDQEIVATFDKNGDKRLDAGERRAAREFMESQGGGRGGFRGRGFGQAPASPPQPGSRLDPSSVRSVAASVPFYDLDTIRTLFFQFENDDWEKELMAFKSTDVEVPATLVVDGKTYKDVGTAFRGASSFMMVPEGLKHSINVSVDAWTKDQNLLGFRSLNLLNSNGDPSHLRALLYLMVAREYIPAARANLVRVALNGESWGIYTNVEQVNKDFVTTWFKTEAGARFKVPGSPGGRGGLEYWGDDIAAYKTTFEIKSKDDPKDWQALVNLTKVLNQTPVDQLEAALRPILNIDGALRFLALDNTLVNTDGYWTRASDYNIYRDTKGVFHILPHDTNETFGPGEGRGGPGGFGGPPGGFAPPPGGFGPGGPGGRGPQGDIVIPAPGAPGFGGRGGRGGRGGFMMEGEPTLDLLIGMDDTAKPLRSKLLAVPALRAKYLEYCRDIATRWLDWSRLNPIATRMHAAIAADVKSDTRKLMTAEAFETSLNQLKAFAEERRAHVLNYRAPTP